MAQISTTNLSIYLLSQITTRLIIMWICGPVDLCRSTWEVHMHQLLGSWKHFRCYLDLYIGLYSLCLNVNHASEYKNYWYTGCAKKSFPLLDKNNSRRINLQSQFIYFLESWNMWLLSWIKIISKLAFHVKAGGTKCKTQNQAKLVSIITHSPRASLYYSTELIVFT